MGRVNVSLDTLCADRFRTITRWGELGDVLRGIAAAQAAGLEPLKVNMVVMRGLNDDEVAAMAQRTVTDGWHVRFIEYMPLGEHPLDTSRFFVPAAETRERLESEFGQLMPASVVGHGPATCWRLEGAEGTVGFIAAISEHFCARCNRLRLTADGRLLPCLLSDAQFDLRTPLRQGADDAALRRLFVSAIRAKPARHHMDESLVLPGRAMSRIGG